MKNEKKIVSQNPNWVRKGQGFQATPLKKGTTVSRECIGTREGERVGKGKGKERSI